MLFVNSFLNKVSFIIIIIIVVVVVSTVFNPVIHEPLSKTDCSRLGLLTEEASSASTLCSDDGDGAANGRISLGCTSNKNRYPNPLMQSKRLILQAELEQGKFSTLDLSS